MKKFCILPLALLLINLEVLLSFIDPIHLTDYRCLPPCCTKYAQKGPNPEYEYNCMEVNTQCKVYCGWCCECPIPYEGKQLMNCGFLKGCGEYVTGCEYFGPGQGSPNCIYTFDKLFECLSACSFDCAWNYANCTKAHGFENCFNCLQVPTVAEQWNNSTIKCQ